MSSSHDLVVTWEQQSPIELEPALLTPNLPPLVFNYHNPIAGEIRDHNFYVTNGQASVNYLGLDCPLIKFHIHTPAEHQVNGTSPPHKLHLVHQIPGFPTDHPSAVLVVGVFLDGHCSTSNIDVIAANYPPLTLSELLPEKTRKYYHYHGSLTTANFTRCGNLQTGPSFPEVVDWIVLKKHAQVNAGHWPLAAADAH